MGCIFCEIARGNKPARVYFEDSDLIVFADILPKASFHLLICPREHYRTLLDTPDAMLLKIFDRIRHISKELRIEDNFRLLLNNGAQSAQIVEHLHFHFMSNSSHLNPVFKTQSGR
jgi:histidine triad (HIT) family protein